MRLALYQPDIPQNTGALLRLAACLGCAVDVIEPCGFLWDDKKIRRAGMDYIDLVTLTRHSSWAAFCQATTTQAGRLILLTTRGAVRHVDFSFKDNDILLLGRESCGVPDDVHHAAAHRVVVAQRENTRSLNVVNAAAIVAAEALRQTDALPKLVG